MGKLLQHFSLKGRIYKNTIEKGEKEVKGGREKKEERKEEERTRRVFLDTSTPVYVGENL